MDPVVDATVRAGLALLLLQAAWHKLGDLAHFRSTLAAYRLLPARLVPVAAPVVVGTEAGVAGLLAVPAARVPALVAAAGLLAVYGMAIAINLARGRRDLDCGCTGPAVRRPISGWLVARNAGLAAVALATAAPEAARPLGWMDACTVAGATMALAALHVALDGLLAQGPAMARLRGQA
jgi:hypothetical protein